MWGYEKSFWWSTVLDVNDVYNFGSYNILGNIKTVGKVGKTWISWGSLLKKSLQCRPTNFSSQKKRYRLKHFYPRETDQWDLGPFWYNGPFTLVESECEQETALCHYSIWIPYWNTQQPIWKISHFRQRKFTLRRTVHTWSQTSTFNTVT